MIGSPMKGMPDISPATYYKLKTGMDIDTMKDDK